MLTKTTAERVALNEAAFRGANERLEAGFADFGSRVDRVGRATAWARCAPHALVAVPAEAVPEAVFGAGR
jgi:hypothetical protein